MKLYFSPGACSLSVRILLNELNIAAEYEAVDLKTKKTATGADYRTINSKGSVPALLIDSKECLTENTTIHQYIADTCQAHQLLPPLGDFKRYRVLEWSSFLSSDMHKSFSPLFNPEVSIENKDAIFIPILKKKLAYLNDHLQGKQYLANDTFTIADAYLFVMLRWLKAVRVDINEWPALTNYFTELKTRKSIQQSLEQERVA